MLEATLEALTSAPCEDALVALAGHESIMILRAQAALRREPSLHRQTDCSYIQIGVLEWRRPVCPPPRAGPEEAMAARQSDICQSATETLTSSTNLRM